MPITAPTTAAKNNPSAVVINAMPSNIPPKKSPPALSNIEKLFFKKAK